MHAEAHPLAGQLITVSSGEFAGKEYRVEDWWDRLTGGSWMNANGNPAALDYAMRSAFEKLPLDDEVVYGKIDAFGKLIHVSQLPDVQKAEG